MQARDQRKARGIRAYISWIFVVSISVFVLLGGLFAVGDLKAARERGRVDASLAAAIAADSVNAAATETTTWMSQGPQWSALLLSIGCSFPEQDGATNASLLDFSALHVLNGDGRIICSSVPGALERSGAYRDASWVGGSVHAPLFSAPFPDPLLGQDAFAFAAPIPLPNGSSGTIAAIIPTATITKRLAAQFGGRLDTSFTLVDARTGGLIASSMGTTLSGQLPAVRPGAEGIAWIDGVDRIYGSAVIPAFDWRLFAGVRESAALAGAWNGILHTLAIVLAGLLVAGLAAAIVYRRVARPLLRLQESIAEASEAATPQPVSLDGPAEVASVAGRFNELIERRVHLEDRMRRAAYEDELTGLATRAMLTDRLDAIARSRPNARPGLFLISLDRFDQARETFGHRVGDQVIHDAANRLRVLTNEGALVARFGEASFAVLLPEVKSSDDLVRLCGMVVAEFSAPFEVNAGWIELGARIGIAGRRPLECSSDAMIGDALIALAEARRTGQPYRFFDGSLRQRTENEAEIEQQLGGAIEHGELFLQYQPIFDLDERRTLGAEALIRWQHPDRGVLEPADFLHVAERSGLMPRIDRFVAAAAIQQAATWHDEGRPVPISFNLSAAGIWEVETRNAIEHAIAFTGVPAKLLTVELTEGALIGESHVVRETLDRLRDAGMAIAIDDFGTGFSSLAYLRRFPIDQLKIDRSFINELGSTKGAALTGAILGIAEALELRVVAEGVETEAQASALQRLHCHRAQGFLFSRPVAADRFVHATPTLPDPIVMPPIAVAGP